MFSNLTCHAECFSFDLIGSGSESIVASRAEVRKKEITI